MLKHGIWRRRLLILCVIAALCGQWRSRVALTMNASADAVAVEAIGVHEGGVDSMAVSMEAAKIDGLRIIAEDANGLTLELVSPPPTIVDGKDDLGPCQQLVVRDYLPLATQYGAPALPVKGALVGIPHSAAVSLEILAVESTLLSGHYEICPIPTPIFEGIPESIEPAAPQWYPLRDVEIYSRHVFTPTEVVSIISTGLIRSQSVAELQFRPFQYNPASGEVLYHQKIRVRLLFANGSGNYASAPIVDEGVFESILKQQLLNYDMARHWRVAPVASDSSGDALTASKTQSISSPRYRILVDQPGLYRITYSDVLAVDPDVDFSVVDPRNFRMYNQGEEIAILVSGEEDGIFDPEDAIIFYGDDLETVYTDKNVYWLTWGDIRGSRMATSDGAPPGTAPTPDSFLTTYRLERDLNYQSSFPSSLDLDHWYWNLIRKGVGGANPLTYPFDLYHIASTYSTATLRGLFYGRSATTFHSAVVALNNTPVYTGTWSAGSEHLFEITVPVTLLHEGANSIKVTGGISGGATDEFYVNWFEMAYQALYATNVDYVFFSGDVPGTWEYHVSGFSTEEIAVFDITSPSHPVHILSPLLEPQADEYTLRFQQTASVPSKYYAVAPFEYRAPVSIIKDVPSSLHDPGNAADYIVITHNSFNPAAVQLADYRHSLGLRTVLVDVQDIYDEFNYGIRAPQAIRDFLAYAYTNWRPPAFTYVVLMGDGNYDPKNNFGFGEADFIPAYLEDVDPWMKETAADNRYVTIVGNDIFPDVYLGRLPVKTLAEAQVMVAKIISYEQMSPTGGWNQKALFVADDRDAGGNFPYFSNMVADFYVPSPYGVDKVYYLVTHSTPAAARAAIVQAINQGRLIVNYVGHGAPTIWASEGLFRRQDIAGLTNGGNLPFIVPMTCLEGYYIIPSSATTDYSAIAETIVRKSGGGAIASFSPTGQGLASGHDVMNKALYQAIFFEDVTALGPATTLSKYALAGMGHDYLIETYLLFGDPALRLNVLPADVALSQTVTPTTPLYPGDWLTYTLTFTNTGPARANNVVIEDLLPAMLLTPAVTSSGATITPRPDTRFVWDTADLVPGAGGRITITAQVPLDYVGTFTHTATIRTTARETATLNNSASLTTQVIAADVEILKTGPHSALPGQTIEYVLAYGNVGTAPAVGVVITDLLRAELLNPVVTSSGPAITPRAGTTFVWDVAPLLPGAQGRITITADVSPDFLGGILSNQSRISTSSPEVQKGNNVSAIVATGVLVPDLIVEQAGPPVALPGMDITYVVTYVNLGNEIASGVVITDLLPAALQNVTVSSAGAVITLCVGGAYVWNVADLPPATGGRITLTGTIAPEFRGTLVNTATIAAKTPDSNPGDNTAVLSTFVSIADVTIAKTGPTAVLAGERLTYTLAFTNTDNAPATGVVITDTLPPELLEVSVTSSLPGVTARPGTPFVWDVPDLAPGAGGTLTIAGRVSPLYRGTLFNQARIAAASPEATTTNNTSARVETFVSRPDVTITKIGPAQVSPGGVMTYTLVYTNADNGLATGVVITDVLPAALMTPTVTHAGATIMPRPGTSFVWDVADLAPGAGGVITLTARVRTDASADLVNTAWIAAANELNTANNGSAPVVTQLLLPDVLIQKRGPATAASGDVITYRLTFTNVGTSLAPGVVITDVLPEPLQGASFTASGAAVTPRAGTTFVWDVADLAPGAGGVLTITATVDAAYAGALTNIASIATSNFESDADHNSAQLVTQITRSYRVYLPLVVRQSP